MRARQSWLWCVCALAAGCANKAGEPMPTPEQLFAEARDAAADGGLFGAGDCLKAEDAVDRLRRAYPYHALSIEADLLLADCDYGEGRKMEAIGRWEAFLRLHPEHRLVPAVLGKVASAYFELAEDYDRDSGAVTQALTAAEELIRRFPAAAQIDAALDIRRQARAILAQRELYVARFYRRTGQWESARERLAAFLDRYGDLDLAAQARADLQQVDRRLAMPALPPP